MITNGFPAEGMGIGTGLLCGYLGQEYETYVPPTLCKLHGIILNPMGEPVGTAGQSLSNVGGVSLVSTWKGVTVSASLAVADGMAGTIISTDKISATTNETGYFELYVIQGLTVTVACPSLGKSIAVPTVGETNIDVSTFF